MLLNNYYNLQAAVLQSSSVTYDAMPLKDVYGIQRYCNNTFTGYPYTRTSATTLGEYAAGISVGRGTSPVKMTDYNLEDTITSGISLVLARNDLYTEENASVLDYGVTITNSGDEDITIGEIGYKNVVAGGLWTGSTAKDGYVILLDRSLITPAITLAPREVCTISYRLRSELVTKMVNGVKIVSWQYGSDEDVGAMIDAAADGLIDLNVDGGWEQGDVRTIHLSAFTAGGNVAHPAEDLDVVITSFDEYMNCGNVVQVDFFNCSNVLGRMHSSNTNVEYETCEMKTTTLPNMANAMPGYLKNRMMTFDVVSTAGNKSLVQKIVSGNKLALRSENEVWGSNNNSGEEDPPISWYLTVKENRQKRKGRIGANQQWWQRSSHKGNNTQYLAEKADGSNRESPNASVATGIAPFFCLGKDTTS